MAMSRSPCVLEEDAFPAEDGGGPGEGLPEDAGSLAAQVRQSFALHGALAHAADEFRERSGQTRMALAVARTIDEGGVLVVEAGTGVGKT
ncbi:MAG: helicase, partial [Variovorax sp.]|nr:helicase [Variovorax sp.]